MLKRPLTRREQAAATLWAYVLSEMVKQSRRAQRRAASTGPRKKAKPK